MLLWAHMHSLATVPADPISAWIATNGPWAVAGLLALVVWTIAWKGLALWFSARGGQKPWFIVLLIVNTLGILEIIYLIWFRPRSFELEEPGVDSSRAS